jgi:membrane-bound serine protease (ClpP class)
MLGKVVSALTPIDSNGGRVFIEGENWAARSTTPINQGDTVKIIAVEGLTLKVIPNS